MRQGKGEGQAPIGKVRACTNRQPKHAVDANVLEDCGLARSRKAGRVRTGELAPKPLRAVEHLMVVQRSMRETCLDPLGRYVLKMKKK